MHEYQKWTQEMRQIVLQHATEQKNAGLRVNWRGIAEIVGRTPRQCYDFYLNNTGIHQAKRDRDMVVSVDATQQNDLLFQIAKILML